MLKKEQIKHEIEADLLKIQQKNEIVMKNRKGHYYSKLQFIKCLWLYYIGIIIIFALKYMSILSPNKFTEFKVVIDILTVMAAVVFILVLLIQKEKLIITDNELIVRKKIITTRIKLSEFKTNEASIEVYNGTSICITKHNKTIMLNTNEYTNGLGFFKLLFNIIGQPNKVNELSGFKDSAARYNNSLIKYVIMDLFLEIFLILIYTPNLIDSLNKNLYLVSNIFPPVIFIIYQLFQIKNTLKIIMSPGIEYKIYKYRFYYVLIISLLKLMLLGALIFLSYMFLTP